MGVDLNSLVSQFLTPQRIGQIASTAGVDPDAAQKLFSAAVPAVLACLGAAAGAPGGAQRVSDAVSNADPDLLTKLGAALGAGNLQLLNDGAGALGGLIGANGLSSLANALGQHADIPPEAAQSAIGAVSQAAMGVIGQQDPSTWSDAASVANLFASQKASILAALPGDLSNLLNASGLLAGLGGLSAAAKAAPAPSASMRPSPAPPPAAAGGSGFPTWLIALIILVVIAAVGYYFYKKKQEQPAATWGPATTEWALTSGAPTQG